MGFLRFLRLAGQLLLELFDGHFQIVNFAKAFSCLVEQLFLHTLYLLLHLYSLLLTIKKDCLSDFFFYFLYVRNNFSIFMVMRHKLVAQLVYSAIHCLKVIQISASILEQFFHPEG